MTDAMAAILGENGHAIEIERSGQLYVELETPGRMAMLSR